jgi:hypothetical protein
MKRWCSACQEFATDRGYRIDQGLPVFDHLGKCAECGNDLTDPPESAFADSEESVWFQCPHCNYSFKKPTDKTDLKYLRFASGHCPRCRGDLSKKEVPEDRSRQIPSDVKQEVWMRDKGKCVQCGSDVNLHFDHDVPFSKGGSSTADNIRILCARCNLKKGDKIA